MPEWAVVVAEVQTAGRGRGGKRWESRRGGLWFSVVLRPNVPASGISLMQFLASNAVRAAIKKEAAVKVGVKWPNDLVVNSGKLGGILVETKLVGKEVSFAIVGIGINVNQAKDALPAGAVSLYVLKRTKRPLKRLLESIVESLKSTYDSLGDPERIVKDWWKNCVHRSRMVEIEGPAGSIVGRSIGLDGQGRLLVQTHDGRVRKVVEGTLRVLNS